MLDTLNVGKEVILEGLTGDNDVIVVGSKNNRAESKVASADIQNKVYVGKVIAEGE